MILQVIEMEVLTTGLPHAEFALDEVLELEPRKPLYSDDYGNIHTHHQNIKNWREKRNEQQRPHPKGDSTNSKLIYPKMGNSGF